MSAAPLLAGRGPRALLPGFLIGAAFAIATAAGTALQLYTGQGFLRAAGFLLAVAIGALAGGLWAGTESAPTGARRTGRWIAALLAYLLAAVAAGAWELVPALHGRALGGGLGMLLLLALPAYTTGMLLGTGTRARAAPGALLTGAAMGVLLAASVLIPRIDPPLAFMFAAAMLFVGILYEQHEAGGDMSEEVVIISGVGARGQLGYALAERFLAAGARVIVTGRSAAVLQLADELAGRGQIVGVTADLTHDEDAERVVAAATERWGRVDALINAAGGLTLIRAAAETSLAELEREVERNAGTLLVLTRAALPALRRSRGAVVNFASPAAAQPPASLGAYAAGKASVVALTRALAVEEKAHGVRVNAIAPGTMDTDQNRASMPDARYVKREDVAELAFFLASRAAAAISGEVITARFETSA